MRRARRCIVFVLGPLLAAADVANAQQCPDGTPPLSGPTRPTFDADVVAVAPFDVLVPGLGLGREGLVDVLSWRHPDAELAGYVEQARQGLRRLR